MIARDLELRLLAMLKKWTLVPPADREQYRTRAIRDASARLPHLTEAEIAMAIDRLLERGGDA